MKKDRDYTELDLDKFSKSLNDPSECYKFYWAEAILDLLETGRTAFTFEEIIDRMIASAWYTVTTYHLRLGPRRKADVPSNNMELAIYKMNAMLELKGKPLPKDADARTIIAALHAEDSSVNRYKQNLTQNVPYRFLSHFIHVPKPEKNWFHPEIVIPIVHHAAISGSIPYDIEDADEPLKRKIIVSDEWASFMLNERAMLREWIQYKKIVFLQARNPGVPGIIYKLEPERQRNYQYVRKLWDILIPENHFMDIYSRHDLAEEHGYDLDHFVPWSYVACDELWNLTPTNQEMNRSKSDRLPDWDLFAPDMLDQQYRMYRTIVDAKSDVLSEAFTKCRKTNLNAAWAVQLYNPSNTEEQFKNLLDKNLHATYNDALYNGFQTGFEGYKQLKLEL